MVPGVPLKYTKMIAIAIYMLYAGSPLLHAGACHNSWEDGISAGHVDCNRLVTGIVLAAGEEADL